MKSANDNFPPSRLMTANEAAIATSLSKPLLVLMSREGQFCQTVQLGLRRQAYVRDEVEAWIDSKIAARVAA